MTIIKVCEVCGRTDENYNIVNYKGMTLCRKHVSQFSRHGKILDKTIYDDNEYIIHDNYAEIILCDKAGNKIGSTLIDIENVGRCKQYKWHIKIVCIHNMLLLQLMKILKYFYIDSY